MARQAIFTCKTVDRKEVTLYKDRYDTHILQEHPELARDYDDPAGEIEHALMNAAKVTSGKGKARIYVGPHAQANPPAGVQQMYVVVVPEREGNGWWVVTAYAEPVLVW